MKTTLKQEKIPLLIISFIYLISFIVSYGHWGDLIIDCGREVYIPHAIASGKVLYKDIFCIYGPFPYLFNAFFIKIFTANLFTFYSIGAMLGLFFITGVYLCAREFLSKTVCVGICLLIMFSVVFDGFIFNYILPYSYAVVFASVFSIWILYSLINYIKTKNPNCLYCAALLWGAICVSKIEFVPVIIPVIISYLLIEKNKVRVFLTFIAYSLAVPFITYFVLFSQGLNFADLTNNAKFIQDMVNTQAIKHFYGNYCIAHFNLNIFLTNLKNLISLIFTGVIFFGVLFFALKRKSPITKYLIVLFISGFYFCILMLQGTHPQIIFAFLPYICTIIFLLKLVRFIRAKEYKNTQSILSLILLIFAISISFKNFHSLQLGFYGSYSFAPLILCLIIFLKELLELKFIYYTKKQCDTALFIFLLILTLVFANILALRLSRENGVIKTPLGTIKTEKRIASALNDTISYIAQHSHKNDTLLVLPEGIMLNYLTQRKWDFYQTSFIPLDFETFGENNILNEISQKKPDYVIFVKRDTQEYGKRYICSDYGIKTCNYITHNYSFEAAFGDSFRVYIFKYGNDNENEQ